MSVLDSLTSAQFQTIINSLDAVASRKAPNQYTEDSMIIEISRLAQDILYEDDSVSDVPPSVHSDSVEHHEMAIGTNELSFIKTSRVKAIQEDNFNQPENSLIVTQKLSRRLTENRNQEEIVNQEAATHARYGKLIRKQRTPKKKLQPSQYSRLYDQAKVKMSRKASKFAVVQMQKATQETPNKQLSTAVSKTQFKDIQSKHLQHSYTKQDLLIKDIVEKSRSVERLDHFSRSTLSRTQNSLEYINDRETNIYERALNNLSKKQQFVTKERQLHQLKEIEGVTLTPRINNSIEVKGNFFQRLEESTQKCKINKALIVHKELNRTRFTPKIPSNKRTTESKIKVLWKDRNHMSVENDSRLQLQSLGKSFNTTADMTKLSLTDKSRIGTSRQPITISIKYSSELDFLLH